MGGTNDYILDDIFYIFLLKRKEQARVQNSLVMQSQLQREKNRIYRENNSRVKLTPVVCIIEIIVIGRYQKDSKTLVIIGSVPLSK